MGTIGPGSRVTFRTMHGQRSSGRIVMRAADGESWVVNTGGRHGTPAVVHPDQFIGVSARSSTHQFPGDARPRATNPELLLIHNPGGSSSYRGNDVPGYHQYRVAQKTLKMDPRFANVMGGPNFEEAQEIVHRWRAKHGARSLGETRMARRRKAKNPALVARVRGKRYAYGDLIRIRMAKLLKGKKGTPQRFKKAMRAARSWAVKKLKGTYVYHQGLKLKVIGLAKA